MTTTTGPRPLTDAETEAWTLHLQKVPVADIQFRTGLAPSQIASAVDLGQVHAQRAMQSSTAVLLPSVPKPTPAPRQVPGRTEPLPGRELPIRQLLAWADQSGHTRALTLAARARTAIEELRTFHAQHDARAKAQAEIDRLTAELEAAKAALREASGKKPSGAPAGRQRGAMPDPDRKAYLNRVRDWAAEGGMPINALGRIPKHIQDAYDEAHGGVA